MFYKLKETFDVHTHIQICPVALMMVPITVALLNDELHVFLHFLSYTLIWWPLTWLRRLTMPFFMTFEVFFPAWLSVSGCSADRSTETFQLKMVQHISAKTHTVLMVLFLFLRKWNWSGKFFCHFRSLKGAFPFAVVSCSCSAAEDDKVGGLPAKSYGGLTR